jgi:site-specific DNA-methyltransferase (adenine-specific)
MQLYNGDCLEVMKSIPNKSIDLILCDLPYGITKCKWDTPIDLFAMWNQYNRIIKDNAPILLFAQTPFDKVLGSSNLSMLKYEWIWEKTQATGHLNAKKMPMKAHENILVFYKKLPIYNPQKTTGHKPIHSYTKYIKTQNNEVSSLLLLTNKLVIYILLKNPSLCLSILLKLIRTKKC